MIMRYSYKFAQNYLQCPLHLAFVNCLWCPLRHQTLAPSHILFFFPIFISIFILSFALLLLFLSLAFGPFVLFIFLKRSYSFMSSDRDENERSKSFYVCTCLARASAVPGYDLQLASILFVYCRLPLFLWLLYYKLPFVQLSVIQF